MSYTPSIHFRTPPDFLAVARLVIFLRVPVGDGDAVHLSAFAIGREAAVVSLVAADAAVDARARALPIFEQVGGIQRFCLDAAADDADARARRARAFFDADLFHQRRVAHEAALVVEDLAGAGGAVHVVVDIALAEATDGRPLRGAVAAAKGNAGLVLQRGLDVGGGATLQRAPVLDRGGGVRVAFALMVMASSWVASCAWLAAAKSASERAEQRNAVGWCIKIPWLVRYKKAATLSLPG